MIVECKFELVGIQITRSASLDTIRVDHIYRASEVAAPARFLIDSGQDDQLLIPFIRVVRAFSDVYARQIRKIWRKETKQAEQAYFQLAFLCSPKWVGLDGHWRFWAQL